MADNAEYIAELLKRAQREPAGVRCPDCHGWGDDGNFQYCEKCAGVGRILGGTNE